MIYKSYLKMHNVQLLNMKKTFLVTGASGFLGSHLADYLTYKKNNVILFDRKKSRYKKNQKMIIGSINNLNDLNRATKNIHTSISFCCFCRFKSFNSKPFETIKSNIIGAK